MAGAAAQAAARLDVQTRGDNMVLRSTIIKFDENKGSIDYARWRREFVGLADSAGADYREALVTRLNVGAPGVYNPADVNDDTPAGIQARTMPQMRQSSLLTALRATLDPNGEATRLILNCWHAGGVSADPAGTVQDQALILLDRRYSTGPVVLDTAGDARKLYNMSWPTEFSVDSYNTHFNTALSLASAVGQNPFNDTPAEILIRQGWWAALATPPESSPYFAAATQARMATGQRCTTVAHRNDWRDAMSTEIRAMVAAGKGAPRGKAVGGRFGALSAGDVLPPSAFALLAQQPQFSGSRTRRCPRCPLLSDGSPTLHASGFKCQEVCVCEVCNSDRHLPHACFIKIGVPVNVKLAADMTVELTRLNVLYKAGQFNWRSTPTTLRWINAMRKRLLGGGPPSVAATLRAAGCQGYSAMTNGYASDDGGLHEMVECGVGMEAETNTELSSAGMIATSVGGVWQLVQQPVPARDTAPEAPVAMAPAGQGIAAQYSSAFMNAVYPSGGGILGGPAARVATVAPPPLPPGARLDGEAAEAVGSAPPRQPDAPHRAVAGLFFAAVFMVVAVLAVPYVRPLWGESVRTNHLLVDGSRTVLTGWEMAVAVFRVYIWRAFTAVVLSPWPYVVMAGAWQFAPVAALMRAGRAVIEWAPRRVMPPAPVFLLAVAALVGMAGAEPSPAAVAARPPSMPPHRSLGFLPAVVSCERTTDQLMGTSPVGLSMRQVSGYEGRVEQWAPGMPFGTWIVDSGADLMIAGAFMYAHSVLLQRNPPVHVRGIDGKHTQVNSLVRAIAQLPDGEYVVREILVCDPFEIALWATEYMGEFGFTHVMAPPTEDSYVQTPTGCRVVLAHRPYRMVAPCRSPDSGPLRAPGAPLATDASALTASTVTPRVRVDSDAASGPVGVAPSSCLSCGESGCEAYTCAFEFQLASRVSMRDSMLSRASPAYAFSAAPLGDLAALASTNDCASAVAASSARASAAAGSAPRAISQSEAWDLHRSMMHAGWQTVARSHNVTVPAMPLCEMCMLMKSKRTSHKAHEILSTFAGQLTHSDTWGPFMNALYYKGCRYVVAFKDDYSRVGLFVFCVDRTSKTLIEAYKVYAAMMRKYGVELTGEWLSDGGPEYVSEEAYDFCDEHAIQRLLSVRYTPPQNGTAESMFRVHVPRTRTALGAAGLPKAAYAIGMQYSMWLANRSHSKSLGFRPFDRLPHPPKHELHHALPLGCRVWAHQPDVDRTDKMSATSRAGLFGGMSELYKGAIIYYPDTHEFEAAIHYRVDKAQFPLVDSRAPPPPPLPLPPATALPPVHVRERVRAPAIPRIPPPDPAHLQVAPPRARGAPPAATTSARVPTAAPPPAQLLPPRRLFPQPPPYVPPMPLPAVAGNNPPPRFNRHLTLPPMHGPAVQAAPRRPGSRARAGSRASLAVVTAWLAATAPAATAPLVGPPDGMPVVVLLFSGAPDSDGMVPLARAFSERGAWPVVVDVLVGGRFHDLLNVAPEGVGWHLLRAAEHGDIQGVHAAVPCATFSVALDDTDVVRSARQPMGISGLSPAKAAKLFASNALLHFTVDLARVVVRMGGQVTIENPSPRMDVALPHVYWAEKAHHASLFRTKVVQDYARDTASEEITTPLCACGLDMQKYVTVLSTPGVAAGLQPLNGIMCAHDDHPETAYGVTEDGRPAAALSARYPWVFCVCIACAHLRLSPPSVDYAGASPLVVPAALGASGGVPSPSWRQHVPSSSSGLPILRGFSDPDPVKLAVGARGAGARRAEEVVRAPEYEDPTGPGWWDDVDEGDLSDDGDDVFAVSHGTVIQAYHACFKVPTAALKAAVRTRYSVGPSGDPVRHDVPRGYDEASVHPDAARLWEAMIREHSAHIDCGTWVLRPASECYEAGLSPIDCMWVYDCKVDVNTKALVLWKARLVARGDQMVYLRDYTSTYSGVVRHATWRLFLALCASFGLTLTGADVSTAYLHAPLREHTVWMKQPKGFVDTIGGVAALCLLRMAIYGLKQSAREWAITVIAWLTSEEIGFRQCVSDRYLFVRKTADGVLILLIWVDDIFLGHSAPRLRESFMTAFKERFRVKDLGPLRQALGASIAQSITGGWVSFSLEKYISDLARRFDLFENVAWADIPVPVAMAKECMTARPTDAQVAETLPVYNVLSGSITFVATFARPDLAYAAYFLATFLVRPGPVHLRLARRVLGYLSRTRKMAITYRKGGGDTLLSFSPDDSGAPDASGLPHMLSDTDHGVRRSVSGWLFMFAGAAASWAVRAQVLPSLSSTESELYGLSTGVCDLLVCVQVLEEMGVVFVAPVTLLTDSRGARLLSLDEASSARTRHIHRRWFFVRYHIDEGRVVVSHIKGSLNRSNFLTKPVGGAPFAADRAYALGIPAEP